MKRTYVKPAITKSPVKLQTVTALVITTGPDDTAPNGGGPIDNGGGPIINGGNVE